MKLKTLTLITLFLFVSVFAALAFWNPNTQFLNLSKNSLTNNTTNNTSKKISIPINEKQNTLTLETVAKHNTPDDCYLVVNGAVYNVSSYINQHPGGKRNITSRCGGEATKVFSAIHSNFAWNLLKDFYVGNINKNTPSNTLTPLSETLNTLQDIESKLKNLYPNTEIVDIKPRLNFFVAKIIKDNAFYEIHINAQGKVIKEEIQNDELDWSAWDDDSDD